MMLRTPGFYLPFEEKKKIAVKSENDQKKNAANDRKVKVLYLIISFIRNAKRGYGEKKRYDM